MNIPFKEVLDAFMRLPKAVRVIAYVLALAGTIAWGLDRFGPNIKRLAEDALPQWDLVQMTADQRHVGEDCEHKTELLRGVKTCQYRDDAVLVRRSDGSRMWSIPSGYFGPPPVVAPVSYGFVSGAGLSGGEAIEPPSWCWQPPWDHPNLDLAVVVWVDPVDDCYSWRWMNLQDGCQLKVLYECSGKILWDWSGWTHCEQVHG